MSLGHIEELTKEYSRKRAVLAQVVRDLNARLEAAKRVALPDIKAALAATAEAQHRLQTAVEAEPQLFVKPRTYIFHGVKVGMQKGKGGIEWEDDNQVVKLIRKHFPEQTDSLIKVTEKPVKSALNGLSVAELKRISCTAVETGDQVVIKPTDSEVDKLVDALLKEAADTETGTQG